MDSIRCSSIDVESKHIHEVEVEEEEQQQQQQQEELTPRKSQRLPCWIQQLSQYKASSLARHIFFPPHQQRNDGLFPK